MSPTSILEQLNERVPDRVTEHDRRQLDVFEDD
jgi:hypothetical protein